MTSRQVFFCDKVDFYTGWITFYDENDETEVWINNRSGKVYWRREDSMGFPIEIPSRSIVFSFPKGVDPRLLQRLRDFEWGEGAWDIAWKTDPKQDRPFDWSEYYGPLSLPWGPTVPGKMPGNA